MTDNDQKAGCGKHTTGADGVKLPGLVKPLEWHDCADGTSHDDDCQYEIARDGKYWRVIRGVTGGTSYLCHADTLEAAKSAAQADYTTRILAAIDADAIAGMVEALRCFVYETTHLSPEKSDGSHWCKISKDCLEGGHTALARLGGGE